MKQLIILGILALFLISPSITAQEQINAPTRLPVFQCLSANFPITITNTGTTRAYTVESTKVQINPNRFQLSAGQSITINEKVPENCELKTQKITIRIKTTQSTRQITQTIEAYKPLNLKVSGETDKKTTPCKQTKYEISLNNPVNFTETYTIIGEKNTIITPSRTTILPGEQKNISITINPQDCTQTGILNTIITIKTDKTKITQKYALTLRISNFDVPEITFPSTAIRSELQRGAVPFTLTNKGTRETTYELQTTGADFIRTSQKQITLKPAEKATINLEFNPSQNTQRKQYKINITAKVRDTGVTYGKTITVDLRPLQPLDAFKKKQPLTFYSAVLSLIVLSILTLLIARKVTSPEFKARRAQKRAEREKRRQEKLKTKETLRQQKETLKKQKEEINSKEEKTKKEEKNKKEKTQLRKIIERELKKDYLLIAKKTFRPEAIKRRYKAILSILGLIFIAILGLLFKQSLTFGITALVVVIVIVLYAAATRKKSDLPKTPVELKKPKQTILTPQAAFVIILLALVILITMFRAILKPFLPFVGVLILALILLYVALLIKRNYAITKTYKELAADTPTIIKTKWKEGLQEITFQVSEFRQNFKLQISKQKQEYQETGETPLQYFTITPSQNNMTFDITYTIPKKWLNNNDRIKLVMQKENNWEEIESSYTKNDAQNHYYRAKIPGQGTYALVGIQLKTIKRKTKALF